MNTAAVNTLWLTCPRFKITSWVPDERVEDVVRAIISAARTGRMGDGRIFILPADAALRLA